MEWVISEFIIFICPGSHDKPGDWESNKFVIKEKEGSDDYFTPKPSIGLGIFYFNDLRNPSS